MGIEFNGLNAQNEFVVLADDDIRRLQMSNSNGRAFLEFLGVDPGEHVQGQLSVPDARRAVVRARALFEKRVDEFTAPRGRDRKNPQIFLVGRDRSQMADYLERFERLVEALAELGATQISWT
jgi:hypothetical protein